MNEIKILKNCINIKIENNNLIIKDDKETYINDKPIGNNDLFYKIYSNNGSLYCSENERLYSIEDGIFIELLKKDGISNFHIINNNILCHKRVSRKELYYELCSMEGKVYWKTIGEDSISSFADKYLEVSNRIDLDNFEIKDIMLNDLWKYNIPSDSSSFWIRQVVDNILFFTVSHNDKRTLSTIFLDIETGKQLWQLDESNTFQINPENNLLYGYSGSRYQVVDPKAGKMLECKDIHEYYPGSGPVSFNNTIGGGKLWFVSGRGEKAKFGAIDLKTSEMDFIQDFPLDEDFQFSKPVYHDGKLYLIDSNKVLRIFE